MRLLVNDPFQNQAAIELGAEYVDPTLFHESDVISLRCPLFPENYHLLDSVIRQNEKKGVMIINTSRGALLNSRCYRRLKQNNPDALGFGCG